MDDDDDDDVHFHQSQNTPQLLSGQNQGSYRIWPSDDDKEIFKGQAIYCTLLKVFENWKKVIY